MSRNLGTTRCECGFWAFADEVTPDDPSLLTEAQYLKAIYWEDCPYQPHGYGYRDDLDGFTSRTVDGIVNWTYSSVAPEDRYRYRKVECPLCLRRYVAWMVQQPAGYDQPHYEIYDLSFWDAFNDEPSNADLVGVREISAVIVTEAIRMYMSMHSDCQQSVEMAKACGCVFGPRAAP